MNFNPFLKDSLSLTQMVATRCLELMRQLAAAEKEVEDNPGKRDSLDKLKSLAALCATWEQQDSTLGRGIKIKYKEALNKKGLEIQQKYGVPESQ